MPEYFFTDGSKIVSVIQKMRDPHIYKENEKEFERIWQIPRAAKDTRWNSLDSKDFINKTREKKGSLGDLWNKSKELSEIREKECGKDFVKEKTREQIRKQRGGGILPCEVIENKDKVFYV